MVVHDIVDLTLRKVSSSEQRKKKGVPSGTSSHLCLYGLRKLKQKQRLFFLQSFILMSDRYREFYQCFREENKSILT
mgnify:CR=1 FL=1